MKAREYLYYLVERVTEKGTSLTKYRESTITNQTLYIEKENEKIRYLLTEFADDYEIRKKNAAKITHVYMNDILGISDVTAPESLHTSMMLLEESFPLRMLWAKSWFTSMI